MLSGLDAEPTNGCRSTTTRHLTIRASERVAPLVPAHEPELRALATDLLVDVWRGKRMPLPGQSDPAAACVDAALRILAARWHRHAQRTPGLRSRALPRHD
jgi:hypothetical protein